ncbi:MAG: PQQ-binding-like beta-propeller repeat protein [Candidatus Binatus sp.]
MLKRVVAAVCVAASVILAATSMTAETSTAWPTFRHDREHTGRSEFNADPNHRTPKWRFTFPQAKAFSDPVIDSKGTIYTSAFEYDPGKNSNSTHLFALNPDGTKKWAFGTTGLINAEWGASPAIGADGTIYVAGKETNSHSSTSAKIYVWAINPYGTLKWKFSTNGSGVSSPVIGSDGVVYVGSVDLSADGSLGGNLYAINANGTFKWRYATGSVVDSSPAISTDGTIYVGSYGAFNASAIGRIVHRLPAAHVFERIARSMEFNLYAINRDGTLKWKFKTDGNVNSSPAVDTEGTIYAGGEKANPNSGAPAGRLYAVSAEGRLKWRFTPGNQVNFSPAIGSDGTIYIGSKDGYLFAVNSDGTLKWKFIDSGEGSVGTPATIGGDGTIFVGGNNLWAINPEGTLKWKYEHTSGSPVIGTDGTLYFECGPGAGLCAMGGIGS